MMIALAAFSVLCLGRFAATPFPQSWGAKSVIVLVTMLVLPLAAMADAIFTHATARANASPAAYARRMLVAVSLIAAVAIVAPSGAGPGGAGGFGWRAVLAFVGAAGAAAVGTMLHVDGLLLGGAARRGLMPPVLWLTFGLACASLVVTNVSRSALALLVTSILAAVIVVVGGITGAVTSTSTAATTSQDKWKKATAVIAAVIVTVALAGAKFLRKGESTSENGEAVFAESLTPLVM
eukprot:1974316-Pleurochrysis_carterae.AAC.1